MMKLTISAAALIAAAAFFTVPASADHIGGGAIHSADGKCWKDSSGPRDGRFGPHVRGRRPTHNLARDGRPEASR